MPISDATLDSIVAAICAHALIQRGVSYSPPDAVVATAKIIAVDILNQFGPILPPTGTAVFLQEDDSAQGTWKGLFGSAGVGINSDALSFPSYVQVLFAGTTNNIWENPSVDVRALQKEVDPDRIASSWYAADFFTIELIFSDALVHNVAFYFLDWDGFGPRIITTNIADSNGKHLDTRSLSQFQGGKYLQWAISGHVIINIANQMIGSNAVVSGIFFD